MVRGELHNAKGMSAFQLIRIPVGHRVMPQNQKLLQLFYSKRCDNSLRRFDYWSRCIISSKVATCEITPAARHLQTAF